MDDFKIMQANIYQVREMKDFIEPMNGIKISLKL